MGGRDAKGPGYVFVHTYDLNATLLSTVTSSIGINPAYAAHSPERSAVYITNEVVEGVVKAFSCCPETKRLTYLNEQPCGGEGPCFLAIGPGPLVYCANYFSGELTAFTTEADGSLAPGVTTPLPGAASRATWNALEDFPEGYSEEYLATTKLCMLVVAGSLQQLEVL